MVTKHECPTPHKLQFMSRREALQWAKKDARSARYAYRCPCGQHWHVSSLPRREGRKKRRILNDTA